MADALPEEDIVSVFWRRLSEAKLVNACLKLPTDVDWMGTPSMCPRSMYVRPCYEELWRQIKSHLQFIDNYAGLCQGADVAGRGGGDEDGDKDGDVEDAFASAAASSAVAAHATVKTKGGAYVCRNRQRDMALFLDCPVCFLQASTSQLLLLPPLPPVSRPR